MSVARSVIAAYRNGSPMIDLQSRLLSPCSRFDPYNSQNILDVPSLFRRLLLFETYILETGNLLELVQLVRILGMDNVLKLLDSGALQLGFWPVPIAQIGQLPDGPDFSRGKPPLPPLSFAFSFLLFPHPNEFLLRRVASVHRELYGYVGQGDLMKLEGAILRAVCPARDDAGSMAVEGHQADLRSNSPVLKKALAIQLRQKCGIEVSDSELALRLIAIDESDFKAESNLSNFGLSTKKQHELIEAALLANGALNSRIVAMRNHEALSGAIDAELPLFAGKFDFLGTALSPGIQEKTFDRVVKVRQLPSFDMAPPDRSFDMDRLLEIRRSKECIEFRAWLRTMGAASDEEVHERVNTLRVKLGPLIQSKTGKTIRIAISTVVGLIPIVGSIVGLVLSSVDSFVLERLFPVSGPTLFLSRHYPSLFKTRDTGHPE